MRQLPIVALCAFFSFNIAEARDPSSPSNDDFADACLISGESGTTNSSTIVATRENGEPEHADSTTGSVWWRWTAPADGCVAFNTDGSDFDTVMAVYSGASLESLVELHSNDDYEASVGKSSRCVFEAAGGTAYSIAVAGYSGSGNVVLNWKYFVPAPLAMDTTNVTALIEDDGEHWEYRLSASGGAGNYSWSLADRAELPGGLWLYANGWLWGNLSTDDFGGHSLGVVVTDAFGTNATATIALTISDDPNHRPVIDSCSPGADAIVVRPGENARFSVEAHDPDGDALTNVWSLYEVEYNEEDDYYDWQTITNLEQQADGTILFSPESLNLADGRYGIEVAVGDGARTTYNSWTVIVGDPEALLVKTPGVTALVEGDNGDWWSAYLSASGGVAPYSWSLAEGSELPCGLSLEPDGELYGWPTSADIGTYSFVVVVTDALGTNAAETITLTVSEDQNHRPVIDTCRPDAEAVVVPSGETADFSVEAHDPDGDAMTYEWSLYQVVYDEEKGYYDWTWIADPWPQADETIRFSPENLELADGQYGLEVVVGDGARTTYCSWIVVVGTLDALAVDTTCVTAPVEGEGGDWWNTYLSASGGVAPYSWSLAEGAELPGDLVLDNDGELYGWPTSADIGTNEFNVVVTDAIGTEAVATLTLRIEEDANSRPVIDSCSPDAEVVVVRSGETVDFSVEAHDPDGDAMTYAWSLYQVVYNDEKEDYEWEWVADLVPRSDGTVLFSPDDLNLANGRYGLDVAVGDGARTTYGSWMVQVGEPEPLAVETPCVTALVEGEGGDWWNVYLSAIGGVAPYSWSLAAGAELPGDLVLDNDGELYGWPTSADIGTYTFAVIVTDALGTNATETITLTVSEDQNHRPVIDSCLPEAEGVVIHSGETADFSVEAHDPDGDAMTYEWSIYKIEYDEAYGYDVWRWIIDLEQQQGKSALFSPESLELTDGRYGIEVAVGDGARTAYSSWIVVVGEPEPPLVETTNIPVFVEGDNGDLWYAYLSASGGVSPYSWSLAEGAELPCGLSLESDGELYGWPTSADMGTYTFDVLVVDAVGAKATVMITLSVSEDPNHRPVINAHSPDSAVFCEMSVGQTQVFSVSAADPDGDDIAVSWKLYELVPGEYDAAGFLIGWSYNPICDLYPQANGTVAFSPSALGLAGGQYYIEATISDGLRDVYQNWDFDILEPGTVFFASNGGTGLMAPIKIFANDMVTLPVNTFKRNGRTFMGWARSANGSVAYADKASVKNLVDANGSVTLYAQWAVSWYKVKFSANGGKLPKGKKMAAQTFKYGTAAKLRKNVFTRKGYVFIGWAKSKNGAVAYKNAKSVKNLRTDGGTTTLYAKWAKKTYKVAFYGTYKGVTGTMAEETFTYGKKKKLSANKFKRKGYKFKGWAKSKALAKKGAVAYKNKAAVKNLVTNGKTVKLYAVWKKK